MSSKRSAIDDAIDAAQDHDYLRALTMFIDLYGTEDSPPLRTPKDARGLSYFGLCLALVQKKYKPAIDLCRRAVDLEFYNGAHYANLTRVYAAAGNRKKAIETAEAGLKLVPEHEGILKARAELGHRARPAVPFLDRSHPINVSLGQARHAKKVADAETSRKKR